MSVAASHSHIDVLVVEIRD